MLLSLGHRLYQYIDVDVLFMQLQRHGWDIHAVSMGRLGRDGREHRSRNAHGTQEAQGPIHRPTWGRRALLSGFLVAEVAVAGVDSRHEAVSGG
jgi:hypothetical protein